MRRVPFASFLLVGFAAMSSTAYAGPLTFSGAGPGDSVELSASVLFEVSGSTLKSTLIDTSNDSASGNDLSANAFDPHATDMRANSLLGGEVAFTMLIAGGSLLESQAANVGFQYGTTGLEPRLPAGMSAPASIPEPATLLLLAPAIGLALRRRLRRKTAHGRMLRA
jgi:hypothetical protein